MYFTSSSGRVAAPPTFFLLLSPFLSFPTPTSSALLLNPPLAGTETGFSGASNLELRGRELFLASAGEDDVPCLLSK